MKGFFDFEQLGFRWIFLCLVNLLPYSTSSTLTSLSETSLYCYSTLLERPLPHLLLSSQQR